MHGKIVSVMIVILLSIGTLTLAFNVQPAMSAGTIRVPQDYPTIQEAYNAASSGDTILVASGVYFFTRQLTIEFKSVSIIGEDRNSTIVDGSKIGTGGPYPGVPFLIASSVNATISGLTIQGGSIGIGVQGGAGCVIENCIIKDILNRGIDTQGNSVIDNNFFLSNHQMIEGAICYGGGDCSITNDTFINNNVGIWLNGVGNFQCFHNNFINNTNQLYGGARAGEWDDGQWPRPTGNFYSDYTGIDDGSGVGRFGEPRFAGDGVGDTNIPYFGVDWYPLMSPYTQNLSFTLVTCLPNPVSIGSSVSCIAYIAIGSNPTGTVTWSTNSITGSFSSSTNILSSGSCSTNYIDTSAGNVTIAASYGGDANNSPSNGSTTLAVYAPSPTTYRVSFEESGVGNPTQVWSVALDGYGTEYSNGPGNTIYKIIFTGVANGGRYQFIVAPPSGFVAQPTADPITVDGGDFNQSITFNQVPVTYTSTLTAGSGGNVSYSFSLGSGTVLSGQSQQLTVPPSCQFTLTAKNDSLHVFQTWSTTGSVSVLDPSSASTTATVNGNGGMTANFAYNLGVSISPTSASIQAGQNVSFTATPSGGSGGYTYVWYWAEHGTANVGSYNSGSSSTYTFDPSEADNYGVYVVVADSSGNTGQSLGSSVAVTDFQLEVSPQEQTVPITENAIFGVQAVPLNGFSGSVTLTISDLPKVFGQPPARELFNPDTIQPLQKSTLALNIPFTAQVGNTYLIDVVATSGQLSHHQTVTLYVTKTIGVENYISISDLGVEAGSFSIQQNFIVFVPSTNANEHYAYWAQNVIFFENISGQYRMAAAFQIFDCTNFQGPYGPKWCNPNPPGLIYSNVQNGPIASFPATFEFTSVLSGNELTLTNDCTSWSWQIPSEDGQQPNQAFIMNLYVGPVPDKGSPEFVLVGPPSGTSGHADFLSQTSGSVESFAELMGQPWTSSLVQSRASPTTTMTGENSSGLHWNIIGADASSFSYESGSDLEGIFFMPSGSSTLQGGSTMEDQTLSTGVSVSIAGSSASDGTSVSITTAALSGASTGVVQVGTTPAAYYDVNVQGISDGTASVCITNSGVLGSTTLQYWNGVEWVMATDVVASGNTICGDIRVSALTGTPVAIGPIQPNDVGVINVSLDESWTYQGRPINISVTTTNFGALVENETLNLFYAGTVGTGMIGSEMFVLAPNQTEVLVFSWNTTGFTYGNYTISAYVWPVLGENNTANNNLTGGNVEVRIPGDINGDGTVDIYDAILLSGAFNTSPSGLNWNPNADINGDGTVDIYDAIIMSAYFNQQIP